MIHIEKHKSRSGLFRSIGICWQNIFVIDFRANFMALDEKYIVGFTDRRRGLACGWVDAQLFILFFTVKITVFFPWWMRKGLIKTMCALLRARRSK